MRGMCAQAGERLKKAQCQCCGAHRPACMCYSSLANRMERTASGQITCTATVRRCSPEAHGRPYPEPLDSLFLEEVHMASQNEATALQALSPVALRLGSRGPARAIRTRLLVRSSLLTTTDMQRDQWR